MGLCVVADGLGGHNAGEVAAQLAVDAVVEVVRHAGLRSPAGCAGLGEARLRSHGGSASLGEARRRFDPDAWPFGYDPSLSDTGNLLRTAVHVASVQVLEAAGSVPQYAGM